MVEGSSSPLRPMHTALPSLLCSQDGITPSQCRALCGPTQKLLPLGKFQVPCPSLGLVRGEDHLKDELICPFLYMSYSSISNNKNPSSADVLQKLYPHTCFAPGFLNWARLHGDWEAAVP